MFEASTFFGISDPEPNGANVNESGLGGADASATKYKRTSKNKLHVEASKLTFWRTTIQVGITQGSS